MYKRQAGTTPADRVHPEVVEVMREVGIDLAGRTPRELTHAAAAAADVVVTMGCGDECPYIPGKRYVDWDLPDPKGRSTEAVRALRGDIEGRVRRLIGALDSEASPASEDDVGIGDGLAARLAGGALPLRGQLQIDRHQSMYID